MLEGKSENLIKIHDNFWNLYPNVVLESINGIPFTPVFRAFNYLNNLKFAREINKAIEKLGFKDFILFNDSDMFRSYHMQELLKPACSVYYTRDNMMSVPFWYKHGRYLEPELMKKSDLVCANSTYLAEVASEDNKNSFYVGQGCDVTAFDRDKIGAPPADIATIPKPVIGYIGAIYTQRLNLDVFIDIAKNRPNWSIVLVGPEDEAFKNSILHQLPNVHFLGLKEGKVLPDYLNSFDVALNPQILHPVTIGNYPRKIDEYLAMGKPVVATETKAMSIFKVHTYLAKEPSEYIALIERALQENNPALELKRIEFARSHTWENNVKEIYSAIKKVKPHLF